MKNKNRAMRNMLIGMIGAAICMAASWLSFAYGKGNIRNGFIQSNWPKMPMIRFELSIILNAIGVPMYFLGIRDMTRAVNLCKRRGNVSDFRMAKIFDMGASLGAIGFLFVNSSYSIMAIVYKLLYVTNLMGADIIATTEGMFYYLAIPVFAYYVLSILGVSIPFIYFLIQDRMRVMKLCIFFNPLFMLGVGELLRLTKIYYLVDFSSAAVPFGYLLLMAAGMSHTAKLPTYARKRRSED
ncbi:MAG: hypothetical protein K6F55_00485 [Eubacterium sp.]|nr:hypothetical protein [Eubacterium sp.]